MQTNEKLNYSFDLNDDEIFTFSEDKYLNKKKKNTNSLKKFLIPINKKDDIKKNLIIRIPLCNLNSNTSIIDNQKVNLINEKLTEIENELNNIPLDSDSEKKEEKVLSENEFNNHKRVLFKYKVFNFENKLLIKENFDLLSMSITNLSNGILLLKKNSKKKITHNKLLLEIKEEIKKVINIIEELNVYMNNYCLNISSLKNSFQEVQKLNKSKNNLNNELNSLYNIIEKESNFCKEKYLLLTKIKKFISYLCNKIIINCENQKKNK